MGEPLGVGGSHKPPYVQLSYPTEREIENASPAIKKAIQLFSKGLIENKSVSDCLKDFDNLLKSEGIENELKGATLQEILNALNNEKLLTDFEVAFLGAAVAGYESNDLPTETVEVDSIRREMLIGRLAQISLKSGTSPSEIPRGSTLHTLSQSHKVSNYGDLTYAMISIAIAISAVVFYTISYEES